MTFGQQVTGNSNVLIANVVNSAITITYQMVSTDLPLEPAAFELPADGRESPSIMLRPRYSVVPFDDYTGLVNDFEDWCLTPGEPFDLRVVSGPGGSGKTRLAVEICRRSLSTTGLRVFFAVQPSHFRSVVNWMLSATCPLRAS